MNPRPGGGPGLSARAAPWLLAAASLALSGLSLARYPTEWDSVQLTLGLDRFDISEGSPHPPGYYLYVLLGRLVRFLTPLDGPASLHLLAALAGAATVGLTYVVGCTLRNRWLGWAAAGFLLTSPFLRFYSSTIATYTFDALIGVLLVIIALKAKSGSRHAVAAAAVLGLGAGLRQTSIILLAPLVIATAVRSVRTIRRAIEMAAAGMAGLAVWLVPMLLEQPGGLSRYRGFSNLYATSAFGGTSVFYGAPQSGVNQNIGNALAHTVAAIAGLVPVIVVAGLLLLLRQGDREPHTLGRFQALLLWQAFLWPLAFVLLVHFGKGGYVLSYLAPLAILALLPVARLRDRSRLAVSVLTAATCLLTLQRFETAPGILPASVPRHWPSAWFAQERYGAPYRLTRTEIRKVDDETRDYLDLAKEFDPTRDVLVYMLGNGGHRFRHATYSLPKFRIHFALPSQDHFLARHSRLFSQRDLEIELPANGRAVFVLDSAFPEVQAAMAAGQLRQHALASGRVVWVAPPGITIFNLTTVVAPDRPLAEHLP